MSYVTEKWLTVVVGCSRRISDWSHISSRVSSDLCVKSLCGRAVRSRMLTPRALSKCSLLFYAACRSRLTQCPGSWPYWTEGQLPFLSCMLPPPKLTFLEAVSWSDLSCSGWRVVICVTASRLPDSPSPPSVSGVTQTRRTRKPTFLRLLLLTWSLILCPD